MLSGSFVTRSLLEQTLVLCASRWKQLCGSACAMANGTDAARFWKRNVFLYPRNFVVGWWKAIWKAHVVAGQDGMIYSHS